MGPRRFAQLGIAAVFAFDSITLCARTLGDVGVHHSWLAAAGLAGTLAATPVFVVLTACVTLVAIARFARAHAELVSGLVALLSARVQHEMFGAVRGVYDENYYHSAAALAGWLAGLGVARALGAKPRDETGRAGAESYALAGALGALGATWVNAGISKLRGSGLSWASSDAVRLMISVHQTPGHSTWRTPLASLVVAHPSIAFGISVVTLVIELGAFLLLARPRVRMLWASLLIAFHAGIFLLSGIRFVEAVVLVALLAYPWVRAEEPPAFVAEPARQRRVLRVAGFVTGACLLCPFLPLPARNHLSAAVSSASPPATPDVETLERFGPLASGSELAGGWRVASLEREGGIAVVKLVSPGGELAFEVATSDARTGGALIDRDGVRISYRSSALAPDVCARAGRALFDALSAGANGQPLGRAASGWLSQVRRN